MWIRSWKITVGTMNYTLYDPLFSRKCQANLKIIINITNRVCLHKPCIIRNGHKSEFLGGTFICDCTFYNWNHTSSLFSSARKNLTSLKMSFFSWFEVDSRAMFKFLVSPPSWKLIWHLAQTTGLDWRERNLLPVTPSVWDRKFLGRRITLEE